MFENRYTTLTYHNVEGGTAHLNEGSEKIDEKIDETIDWVSFKNQFFSAIITKVATKRKMEKAPHKSISIPSKAQK